MGRYTGFAGTIAVAWFANGCVCTGGECGTTASAVFHLTTDAPELEDAQVVGCRNEVCQTASLQPLADGLPSSATTSLEVAEPDPDQDISFDPYAQPTADGFFVTLMWEFNDSSDLQIGDQLSARVLDRNGDELFASSAKVAVLDRDASDGCEPGCIDVQVRLE